MSLRAAMYGLRPMPGSPATPGGSREAQTPTTGERPTPSAASGATRTPGQPTIRAARAEAAKEFSWGGTALPGATQHNYRAHKRMKADKQQVELKYEALATYHNKKQLAPRSEVPVPGNDRVSGTNLREWTPGGVLFHGFSAVGAGISEARRITCCTTDLLALISLSWELAQTGAVHQTLEDAFGLEATARAAGSQARWLWYQRDFDPSPSVFNFGSLRDIIAPHARYYKLIDDACLGCDVKEGVRRVKEVQEKWVRVPFEEKLKERKGNMPFTGVLEMMRMRGSIHWTDSTDPRVAGGMPRSEKFIQRMVFLQRNNASTLYEACDTFQEGLGEDELIHLVASGAVELLVIGLRSDQAKQNVRLKAGLRARLMDLLAKAVAALKTAKKAGRIAFLFSVCVAHILNGVLGHSGDRIPVTTAMYAVSYVIRMPSCHASLQYTLVKLTKYYFRHKKHVRPVPDDLAHAEDVFDATVVRRARRKVTPTKDAVEDARLLSAKFRGFFNGAYDVSVKVGGLPHCCPGAGCTYCQGDPVKAEGIAVEYAEELIFGDPAAPASEAKWWTEEEGQCEEGVGFLFSDLLGTTFEATFEDVELWPDLAPDVEENFMDGMRRFLNKKVVKATAHTTSTESKRNLLVMLIVSEPVAELSSFLEAKDSTGGSLFELTDPKGLMSTVQEELGTFLDADAESQPAERNRAARRMKMLFKHYKHEQDKLATLLRKRAAFVSTQLNQQIEVPHGSLPLILGRVADPAAPEAHKRSIIMELWDAVRGSRNQYCCVDQEFTEQIAEVASDPIDLLPGGRLHHIVAHFGKCHRETTMDLERDLAFGRTAVHYSKHKPTCERQTYSAHVKEIMRAHKDANGLDMTDPQTMLDENKIGTKLEVQKAKVPKFKRNAWTQFLHETYPAWAKERQITGEIFSRQMYARGDAQATWKEFNDGRKAEYGARAAAENQRIADDRANQVDSGRTYLGMPFGLGDPEGKWAVTEDMLFSKVEPVKFTELEVDRASHLGRLHRLGFRNAARKLRWEGREKLFCMDRQRISRTETFVVRKTCAQAHFGLCAWRNRFIFDVAEKIAEAAHRSFKRSDEGTYLRFETRCASRLPMTVYAYLSALMLSPYAQQYLICDVRHRQVGLFDAFGRPVYDAEIRFRRRPPGRFEPLPPCDTKKKETRTAFGLAELLIRPGEAADVELVFVQVVKTENVLGKPGLVELKDCLPPKLVWACPGKGEQAGARQRPLPKQQANPFKAAMEGLAVATTKAQRSRAKIKSRVKEGKTVFLQPKKALVLNGDVNPASRTKKKQKNVAHTDPGVESTSSVKTSDLDSVWSSEDQSDIEKDMSRLIKADPGGVQGGNTTAAGTKPTQKASLEDSDSNSDSSSAVSAVSSESDQGGARGPPVARALFNRLGAGASPSSSSSGQEAGRSVVAVQEFMSTVSWCRRENEGNEWSFEKRRYVGVCGTCRQLIRGDAFNFKLRAIQATMFAANLEQSYHIKAKCLGKVVGKMSDTGRRQLEGLARQIQEDQRAASEKVRSQNKKHHNPRVCG